MTTTVIVYHDSYGCETGCCGHRVELYGSVEDQNAGRALRSAFKFRHCDAGTFDPEDLFTSDIDEVQAIKNWARELVTESFGEEHAKDLDWANCKIVSYECCY